MALPARPQTFALENCRDLLRKLDWEVDELRKARDAYPEPLIYIAFNAAVTAWQLADWVFDDMTQSQRQALGIRTRGDLQEKVRNECRSLYLCRQIATASKHAVVEKHPDVSIEAVTAAVPDLETIGTFPIGTSPVRWILQILDGGKVMPADEVFTRAADYWTNLIYTHGIAA